MNEPYFIPDPEDNGESFDDTQGASSALKVTNAEFMDALFVARKEDEVVWVCFYETPPDAKPSWGGHKRKADAVPDMDDKNAYFSVAAFKSWATNRNEPNAVAAHVFVLDDYMFEPTLEPTWTIQTSRNSRQVGFRLDKPCTNVVTYGRVCKLVTQLANATKKAGEKKKRADGAGNSFVRYVRLPNGINNKREYGETFQCELTHWAPELTYPIEEIEAMLMTQLAMIKGAAPAGGLNFEDLAENPAMPEKSPVAENPAMPEKPAAVVDDDGVVDAAHDNFNGHVALNNEPSKVAVANMIQTIVTAAEGLHDAQRDYAYVLVVHRGVPAHEAIREIRALLERVPVPARDERWRARWREAEHDVMSAHEKFIANETPTLAVKPFDVEAPIPRRKFIEINGQKVYSLGFMTVTGAAGGTGKSSLSIVEELSIVLGVDLFDPERRPLEGGPRVVWSMSLEDDEQEHRRRVWAAMTHYRIKPADLGDRYIVTYKQDSPVKVVASAGHNQIIVTPQVDQIKEVIRERKVAVLIADPFINTHEASENDNVQMNRVADAWRSIGQETGCAIGLTHHMRKAGGMNEASAEDLRGAVSLTAAARIVRVLCNPTEKEAVEVLQIDPERRRFFFFVNPSGKPNIAPPATNRIWYEMKGVELMNGDDDGPGDNVGVATAFAVPDAMDGVTGNHVTRLASLLANADDDFLINNCRSHHSAEKSGKWFNAWVASEVLSGDLDVADDPAARAKVNKIVKAWAKAKVIVPKDVLKRNGERPKVWAIGPAAFKTDTEAADFDDSDLSDLGDLSP